MTSAEVVSVLRKKEVVRGSALIRAYLWLVDPSAVTLEENFNKRAVKSGSYPGTAFSHSWSHL